MSKINTAVGAALTLASLVLVGYMALTGSKEATGALVALLNLGAGFFLRGRIQEAN